MKQLLYSLVLYFICFLVTTFSQNPEWVVYNTANSGLPLNVVRSIAIDSEGNKWITSSNIGLTKFDGSNWTFYDTSNSGLPSNSIVDIAIDKSGDKWIGTYNGGVAKFNDTVWTVYDTSNSGLPSNNVRCLAIDNIGNKWITAGGNLVKFDDQEWVVFDSTNYGNPSRGISLVTIDQSDNIWIGTHSGAGAPAGGPAGIMKYDGTNWTIYDSTYLNLPASGIISMTVDKGGIIWLGIGDMSWGWDGAGLVRFDENDTTMIVYNTLNSPILSNQIECIAIDGNNNKWIAMQIGNDHQGGGLARIDSDDGTWTVYNVSNSGLPSSFVYTISIDEFDNKWIGFFEWGVSESTVGMVELMKEVSFQ